MKSTFSIFKVDKQFGPGFKFIPAIILLILIMIFLGAQAYFFIGTIFEE
jgi:hypothetical protein